MTGREGCGRRGTVHACRGARVRAPRGAGPGRLRRGVPGRPDDGRRWGAPAATTAAGSDETINERTTSLAVTTTAPETTTSEATAPERQRFAVTDTIPVGGSPQPFVLADNALWIASSTSAPMCSRSSGERPVEDGLLQVAEELIAPQGQDPSTFSGPTFELIAEAPGNAWVLHRRLQRSLVRFGGVAGWRRPGFRRRWCGRVVRQRVRLAIVGFSR